MFVIDDDWREVAGDLEVLLALDDDARSGAEIGIPSDDPVSPYARGVTPSAVPLGIPAAELLTDADVAGLADAQLIDLLTLADRLAAWVAAKRMSVLAQIADRDTSELNESRLQVMCASRLSARAAELALRTAQQVCTLLPRTYAALNCGAISDRAVQLICEGAWRLPADSLRDYEARIFPRVTEQNAVGIARSVARAVLALDPDGADRRHRHAHLERRVSLLPAEDGMAELRALLPATQARQAFQRLDDATRLLPAHDARTRDQQRADLLVDAILTGIPDDGLPDAHGQQRPAVVVTLSLETLLGLSQEPADLTGYGPIGADLARRIAADPTATWRRLITDPLTGDAVDYGRKTYRPPQNLIDLITTRDRTCIFPQCGQPASRSDLDHRVPWDQGGTTAPDNMYPLCRRHHQAKTSSRWHYDVHDGAIHWTTPTGHHYQQNRS